MAKRLNISFIITTENNIITSKSLNKKTIKYY